MVARNSRRCNGPVLMSWQKSKAAFLVPTLLVLLVISSLTKAADFTTTPTLNQLQEIEKQYYSWQIELFFLRLFPHGIYCQTTINSFIIPRKNYIIILQDSIYLSRRVKASLLTGFSLIKFSLECSKSLAARPPHDFVDPVRTT